jgi:glycerol kinase
MKTSMNSSRYLLALDQGTSSSRSILFDPTGISSPWRSGNSARFSRNRAGSNTIRWKSGPPSWPRRARSWPRPASKAADVAAIGITNQRETTVVWNRKHRRAAVQRHRLAGPPHRCGLRGTCERGVAEQVRDSTGLVIDAYFSATKLAWILDNIPGARAAAERGELAFGTIDTWLLWQLTGGAVHATDVSNAARTLLFDIHRNRWDDANCWRCSGSRAPCCRRCIPPAIALWRNPPDLLRRAHRHRRHRRRPAGALFGQACFRAGLAKNTYGTGCFLLMHTG